MVSERMKRWRQMVDKVLPSTTTDLPGPITQQTMIELGALALLLAGTPTTRSRFLRLIKELKPSYELPQDVQDETF